MTIHITPSTPNPLSREAMLLASCESVATDLDSAKNLLKKAKPWATMLFDAKESPRLFPTLQGPIAVVAEALARSVGSNVHAIRNSMVTPWGAELFGDARAAFASIAPRLAELAAVTLADARLIRDAELLADPVLPGPNASKAKRLVLDEARTFARERILVHLANNPDLLTGSFDGLPADLRLAYGRRLVIRSAPALDQAIFKENNAVLEDLHKDKTAVTVARSVCRDQNSVEDFLQDGSIRLLKSSFWGQVSMHPKQVQAQLKVAVSRAEKDHHRARGDVVVLPHTGMVDSTAEYDPSYFFPELVSADFSDRVVEAEAARQLVRAVATQVSDDQMTVVNAVLAGFLVPDAVESLFSDQDRSAKSDQKRVRAQLAGCIDAVTVGLTQTAKARLLDEVMGALLVAIQRAGGDD